MIFHEVPTEADEKSLLVAGLQLDFAPLISSPALGCSARSESIFVCSPRAFINSFSVRIWKGPSVRSVAELRWATSTAPLACQAILQPRMFSGWPSSLPLAESMLPIPDVLLVLHMPGNLVQGYFPHYLPVQPVIPLVLLPVLSEDRSGTGFPPVLLVCVFSLEVFCTQPG